MDRPTTESSYSPDNMRDGSHELPWDSTQNGYDTGPIRPIDDATIRSFEGHDVSHTVSIPRVPASPDHTYTLPPHNNSVNRPIDTVKSSEPRPIRTATLDVDGFRYSVQMDDNNQAILGTHRRLGPINVHNPAPVYPHTSAAERIVFEGAQSVQVLGLLFQSNQAHPPAYSVPHPQTPGDYKQYPVQHPLPPQFADITGQQPTSHPPVQPSNKQPEAKIPIVQPDDTASEEASSVVEREPLDEATIARRKRLIKFVAAIALALAYGPQLGANTQALVANSLPLPNSIVGDEHGYTFSPEPFNMTGK